MAYHIDWVVKASKLCNLRCSYCYEWDELADPARMSLDCWERVLTAVRDHLDSARRWEWHGGVVQADIIWHGGEPMLLPESYFEAVLALQRRILPAEWLSSGTVRNTMQTNLYSVSDRKLALLKEHGFSFGVSYDHIGGTRLSAGGAQTEARVLGNIERAQAHGFDPGAILVLAGHTAPHVERIYAALKGRVRRMNVLPLFNGPDARPMQGTDISRDAVIDAMFRLFVAWIEDGCEMAVDPIERYFAAVLNRRLGLAMRPYDRESHGDSVVVVNIDGTLRTPGGGYGSAPIGDLKRQRWAEIPQSDAYRRSLAQEGQARSAICGNCAYFGACNTYPLFADDDGGIAAGECRIAQPVMTMIDGYLDEIGCDDSIVTEAFETFMHS